MNRRIACVVVASTAVALSGCGSGSGTESTNTETVTGTVAPPIESVVSSIPAPISAPPIAPEMSNSIPSVQAVPAVMPNVTCLNLQTAQDLIQAAGVFFSRSDDATGQGRKQIMDRNWVVVSQQPAAGDPVGEGESVLSVVKLGEPGDCS